MHNSREMHNEKKAVKKCMIWLPLLHMIFNIFQQTVEIIDHCWVLESNSCLPHSDDRFNAHLMPYASFFFHSHFAFKYQTGLSYLANIY